MDVTHDDGVYAFFYNENQVGFVLIPLKSTHTVNLANFLFIDVHPKEKWNLQKRVQEDNVARI